MAQKGYDGQSVTVVDTLNWPILAGVKGNWTILRLVFRKPSLSQLF